MPRSFDFAGADAPTKAAGAATFTVDVRPPRLLHARVLRSQYPHARIRSVDVSLARQAPGVRAVLTASDLPVTARSQRVLAGDRVLSVADAVAAVAADSEEAARAALALIRVDYEPLPAVLGIRAAIALDAPVLYPGRVAPALPAEQAAALHNVAGYGRVRCGDVERGFAEADVVVEEEYETPVIHQVALEPHAAVAVVEPSGAGPRVVVWSSNQTPYGTRTTLANLLGLPASQVTVRSGIVGGGFGGKTGTLLEPLAALLALATGRPVRLVNTRYEEFLTGTPRPATLIRIKTGAKRDGTLVARQMAAFGDGGCTGVGWAARLAILALGPYRIPNVLAETYDVFTNQVPMGACRAPGAPPAVFAGESNLDSVARALGMDPLEVRLRNCWRDGDRTASGQLVEHAPVAEALRAAAERIGWNEPTPPSDPASPIVRGKGIAAGWWQSGPGNSTVVLLLNADGSAQLLTGAMEQGPGSAMIGLPLIVAAEIGIPAERVEVVLGATDNGLQDAGSGGSRVTANLGVATLRAAQDVRRQLIERGARELGLPADGLQTVAGEVRDPASGRSVAIAELATSAYATGQIVGRGACRTKLPDADPRRFAGNVWQAQANPAYFAQAVEVEVDRETGVARVLRVASAQDVGYAINRTTIAGQVEGASLQGIGMALGETTVAPEGRMLNASLGGYAVPTVLDQPAFATDILESRKAEGLAGVKGVGEAPICTTPAAVANAVAAAIGRPVRALPLDPPAVLRAIEE